MYLSVGVGLLALSLLETEYSVVFNTPSFVKDEIGQSVSAVLQIGADQEPALVLMRSSAGVGHVLVTCWL